MVPQSLVLSIILALVQHGHTANDLDIQIPETESSDLVVVRKCCEEDHVMNFPNQCIPVNQTNMGVWSPLFTSQQGQHNVQTDFKLVTGTPLCGLKESALKVYDYHGAPDRLILLPTGVLRHYTHYEDIEHPAELMDDLDMSETSLVPSPSGHQLYYEYSPSNYCLDKVLINLNKSNFTEANVAILCVPHVPNVWIDSEFLVRKVVDPVLHGLAIICLLAVAVVYFVLPPLRDLPGNILTTMCICLIVSQAADLVRIFTEFSSHVSFIVADVIMYFSLLGAFFWLNSFGYYIWKTFRSRNVFLRVTDRRKYCYYSGYTWGATVGLTSLALVAHFLFDVDKGMPISPHDQKTIGWLGIALFFSPIAFTILIDIFFYLSTAQTISRMSTYGRIHNKMKFSFEMFIKLFLVMTAAWLCLLLTWLRLDTLIYTNIAANALQAPFILYICVLGQKRVMYLLKKTCCYRDCVCPCCRPDDDVPSDWGEEMLAMNSNHNY